MFDSWGNYVSAPEILHYEPITLAADMWWVTCVKYLLQRSTRLLYINIIIYFNVNARYEHVNSPFYGGVAWTKKSIVRSVTGSFEVFNVRSIYSFRLEVNFPHLISRARVKYSNF